MSRESKQRFTMPRDARKQPRAGGRYGRRQRRHVLQLPLCSSTAENGDALDVAGARELIHGCDGLDPEAAAIVFGAEGASDAWMQSLAAENNLSENA